MVNSVLHTQDHGNNKGRGTKEHEGKSRAEERQRAGGKYLLITLIIKFPMTPTSLQGLVPQTQNIRYP